MLRPQAIIPSLAEEGRESERTVIGSVLMRPERLSEITVGASDFTKQHQLIFDAMLGLAVSEQAFDMSTLIDELKRRGQLAGVGGHAYIFSLTEGMPPRAALKQHCAKIRAASLRRKLVRLCDRIQAGCYDLASDPTEMLQQLRDCAAEIDSPGGLELGLVSAADVRAEIISWLIDQLIPRGCLSLLVADPGDGKTWVSLSFVADLTRGIVPFTGDSVAPQNVIYLSNEDSAGQLRARFDRLGGDPRRVWFESAQCVINLGQAGAIEAAVQKHSAALVVVDTITSHFGGKVDFHKASEVAAVLGPLSALAQRTGASILGLMHLSKSMQGKSLYRVQGSTAFAGAARSVLGLGRDPSDPTKRILVHMKSNGSAQGSSREFVIDNRGVTWGSISGLGAADVLGPETQQEERSETTGAIEFLREMLSQGSRDAKEVESEANKQKIPYITLRRAKSALGVKSRKSSFGGSWIWWLPGDESQGAHEGDHLGSTVQTMSILGNDEHLGKNKGLIEDILPGKHEGAHTDMYRAPLEGQICK